MAYSQGKEEEVILKYFSGRKGVFLDCGANDGITLSNTHALALNGWWGICVEPSKEAFEKMRELYKDRPLIELFNVAVTNEPGKFKMWHSGSHLGTGDVSLLSTLEKDELKRWKGSKEIFEEVIVDGMTVAQILSQSPFKSVQMVSIDCEGKDLDVLNQLNISELGVELFVIEHNGSDYVREAAFQKGVEAGLKNILLINAENIIIAK